MAHAVARSLAAASHTVSGTVAMNMLPLCYGADGCSNSKNERAAQVADRATGQRKAKKLEEIEAYFAWVRIRSGNLPRRRRCADVRRRLERVALSGVWCGLEGAGGGRSR
ncbi:MAG: hypothetical protein U0528_09290 [Anaerolineae bacterium]